MKCKNCKIEMTIDKDKILLSNPPQYIYRCEKCNYQHNSFISTINIDVEV